MTGTPCFIEPDDVDGGYAPQPFFVTRTTLLAVVEDTTQEQKPATKQSIPD